MSSDRSSGVWQKTKSSSKAGFDKVWGWADKLGAPINRLSNKVGSEAFWPTTLDKESDKAARILKSFCKDGFYQEETKPPVDGPKQKQKVLKRIPTEVIKNAKGLAIFTTMRTGLWVSGAGGSGVLIARKPDGGWSQPSGIMLHTAGLGFLIGVDIYDCVVVINTQEALEGFSKLRATVGGEISAVAGPVGMGGLMESEVHKRRAPVFTYLKSRGFYAGVQIDGTVVVERTDANAEYYGQEKISVKEILAGNVPVQEGSRRLIATLKAAQGDNDVDESLLPDEAPPGDFEIENEAHIFGVPDQQDPDPYGVLALQSQGLDIREAGSRQRPSLDHFSFRPSPSSPVFEAFNRQSMDTSGSRRSSWRTSTLSSIGLPRRISAMVDMSTQTDEESGSNTSPGVASPSSSKVNGTPEKVDTEVASPKREASPLPTLPGSYRRSTAAGASPPPLEPSPASDSNLEAAPSASSKDTSPETADSPANHKPTDASKTAESALTEHSEHSELSKPAEPTKDDDDFVIHEVHQAPAAQAIRARLVNVPKRPTPQLPPRNPIRDRKPVLAQNDVLHADLNPNRIKTPAYDDSPPNTDSIPDHNASPPNAASIPDRTRPPAHSPRHQKTKVPTPNDEPLTAASIRSSLSTEDPDDNDEGEFIDAPSERSLPSSSSVVSSGVTRGGSSGRSSGRSVDSASSGTPVGLHALETVKPHGGIEEV